MSTSLHLYRISSSEAFDWALPLDSVTFCYFFSEFDIDSVATLHSQAALQLAAHPTPLLISIYVGPQQETGFEWVEEQDLASTVFWIGPEGLKSELSKRLEVEETPQLVVMVGDQVKQRLRELPEDLRPLIPVETLPLEVTLTYESLAEYLKGEDTTNITAAYRDITRENPEMGIRGISTLITLLSDRYQLDLSESIHWFASPRYGDDFEDLIDINNITEGMFIRRLKNFCLYKASAGLNPSQSTEFLDRNPGNYEELKDLLSIFKGLLGKTEEVVVKKSEPEKTDQKETEINHLILRISEKEHIIEQLKRELADRNTEITALHTEMQESLTSIVPVSTPQSIISIPTAQSAPTALPTKSREVAKDEFDFWKFGQEEEPNSSILPRFEDIAAKKGLWILTAETQGIGPNIKDWRVGIHQVKGRKRTLPPLQNGPMGPERRIGSRVAAKKTKPMEKGVLGKD